MLRQEVSPHRRKVLADPGAPVVVFPPGAEASLVGGGPLEAEASLVEEGPPGAEVLPGDGKVTILSAVFC